MSIANTLGRIVLVACTVVNGTALAAEMDRGWYGGISVGLTKSNVDEGRINGTLLSAGFATSAVTGKDDSDTGYKVFAGYQFNRNFAVEGGYFDLGRSKFTAVATGPAGSLIGTTKPRGVNLDAVGILPIGGNFSAIGRVGALYSESDDAFTGTGNVAVVDPNPGKRDANFKFGAGLQYDFTKSVGLRGEIERYRVSDSANGRNDVNLYSMGVVVKFR